jgi:hypothetical protein
LVCTVPSKAGEKIVSFQKGSFRGAEVLPHVILKAVVSEFLDPEDTGIGKAIGYLIWREVLTAISDQAGAGVILAHPPGEERLVDMLARNYHRAAENIAKSQRARMALWGVATEEGGRVYVNTYLSVLTGTGTSDLRVKFVPGKRFGPQVADVEATIPRTRFNFALVATSRVDLFKRRLVTRGTTILRDRPSGSASKVARVRRNTILQAVDMEGAWFKIQLENGQVGYVENSKVNLPPRQVEASVTEINLRSGPGTDFKEVMVNVDLKGTFPVLDMRYRKQEGLWYRIRVADRSVWVWAGLVRPRFTLPAVHFIAGLYRFYGDRFRDAEREFRQFINAPDVRAVNVNLSTAHQLLGASQIIQWEHPGPSKYIFPTFSKAVELTPYDPSAYLLRAVAGLVVLRSPRQALADLDRALELDRRDKDARSLALAIWKESQAQGGALNKWTRLSG